MLCRGNVTEGSNRGDNTSGKERALVHVKHMIYYSNGLSLYQKLHNFPNTYTNVQVKQRERNLELQKAPSLLTNRDCASERDRQCSGTCGSAPCHLSVS